MNGEVVLATVEEKMMAGRGSGSTLTGRGSSGLFFSPNQSSLIADRKAFHAPLNQGLELSTVPFTVVIRSIFR